MMVLITVIRFISCFHDFLLVTPSSLLIKVRYYLKLLVCLSREEEGATKPKKAKKLLMFDFKGFVYYYYYYFYSSFYYFIH